MNTQEAKNRVSAEIVDQASTWFVESSEGAIDGDGREAFIEWLRTSPEHVRAYLQVAAVWEDAIHLDHGRKQDRDELIALARAEANVVALRLIALPLSAAQPAGYRRIAVAAAILIAALGGGLYWYQHQRAPTYATDIGEQRSVRLTDGSTVELNARSKVRVEFTEGTRSVELLEGQAIFRVAKDHVRPFVVESGATLIRAVGTAFDVDRTQFGTTVTVLEGQVAIESPRPRQDAPRAGAGPTDVSAATLVGAGEQLKVSLAATPDPEPADIAAVTAWTRRQFVFQRASLTEVVEEFNRYNPRQMVVQDQALAATRISGVFSSTDPTSLLHFLRELPEVSVEETDTEVRISRK
jgi:transmembrane sensor